MHSHLIPCFNTVHLQYFSSNRLCLLDRGWVFAMAHIRGVSHSDVCVVLCSTMHTFTRFGHSQRRYAPQGRAHSHKDPHKHNSVRAFKMAPHICAYPQGDFDRTTHIHKGAHILIFLFLGNTSEPSASHDANVTGYEH